MFRQVAQWLRGGPGDPPPEAAATTQAAPPQDWLEQGNAALGSGRIEEALALYQRATQSDPAHPLAWLNQGFAFLELGDTQPARDSLVRALGAAPAQAPWLHEAHFLIGRAWLLEGQPPHAEAAWRQALALAPGFVEARVALADSLAGRGREQEALSLTEAAPPESRTTDLAMVRARALHGVGRMDEALATLDGVIAASPANAAALDGRGNVLLSLDRDEDALAAFEQAASAGGANADRLANLATAAHRLGRLPDALRWLGQALELDPTHARARYNRGVIHLQQGELPAGWAGFEARWDAKVVPAATRLAGDAPEWQGEDLQGRSLLVNTEQGLGDCIQFLRYVPLLARRGAQVHVRVHPLLVTLARASGLPGTVLATGDAVPAVDYQCPDLSLPHRFGTSLETVPRTVPYLHVDADALARGQAMLPPAAAGRPRVGLVWSGNPEHPNDRNRSIPLEAVRQALAGAEASFVALQPEVRAGDRAALQAWPGLAPLGAPLRDFMDTAAVMESLDLVVCVDTSVAHLAGALGRPVWILLPWMPDWRWLMEREDSPWYPSARLFRQARPRDWSQPLQRARAGLDALAVAGASR